jgi:hypothetical protein
MHMFSRWCHNVSAFLIVVTCNYPTLCPVHFQDLWLH